MPTYSIRNIAKKLSDWKIIIGVIVVVGTTLFNSLTSIFNYALITKLEPINQKITAIEQSEKDHDVTFDEHKSDNDRDYGNLTNKVDSIANKLDALTLRLIGKVIK